MYDRIQAVGGGSGRAPIDPKILVTLSLYATVEGLGGARHLDGLGREHAASQWIVGDVSTTYHTLADSRTAHVAWLDDLLTRSVATRRAEDLVGLNRVAQDGMRARASAGAASFRRRPTLGEAYARAQAQVDAPRDEGASDPAADGRRRSKARPRAERQRAGRIKAASGRLPGLESKEGPEETDKARASTTDPQATVMKMADGGSRPASDVPGATATATDSQVIVGVEAVATGSDAGRRAPMVAPIRGRYGEVPAEMLVDGGFARHDAIGAISVPAVGGAVYAPAPKPEDPEVGRFVPEPTDGAAVAAWRERRATDRAQAISKGRAATAGWVPASARGRGSVQPLVRGLEKAKALALWYAPAQDVMRAAALRTAIAGGAWRGQGRGGPAPEWPGDQGQRTDPGPLAGRRA